MLVFESSCFGDFTLFKLLDPSQDWCSSFSWLFPTQIITHTIFLFLPLDPFFTYPRVYGGGVLNFYFIFHGGRPKSKLTIFFFSFVLQYVRRFFSTLESYLVGWCTQKECAGFNFDGIIQRKDTTQIIPPPPMEANVHTPFRARNSSLSQISISTNICFHELISSGKKRQKTRRIRAEADGNKRTSLTPSSFLCVRLLMDGLKAPWKRWICRQLLIIMNESMNGD